MARKSIKGYSEKNYYDNTKFSGVTATYDVLNEGSFRHMANLDISDTGKSVTPRKGYLTTEFVNNEGHPIALTKNTIYFQEPTTGEYIFLDFSSVDQTTEKHDTVEFNPALTWSCDLNIASNGYVSNSIMNSGCVEAMIPYEVENVGTIPNRIVFKEDVQEIHLTSYVGYWEGNNYVELKEQHTITKDNKDGYILLLYQDNEMLPDTPTTTANIQYNFASTENNIILELDTGPLLVNSSYSKILFTKAVRVYDSSSNHILNMNIFKTSFFVANNKFITTPIANVNAQDLLNYLSVKKNELIHIKPVNNNFAEIIYDEYGVKQNVIKVDYLEKQFWINLVYNKTDDMLYLTPVHTEDPVGILSGDRNIASDQSIIPDPIYQIYEKDKAPIGHYNRIPMIYAEQDGKYLVETANTLSRLELKPSFFIEDFSSADKYEWAYTYDIRSTSPLNVDTYTSPIYNLDTHNSYSDFNLLNRVDTLLKNYGFSLNVTTEAELRDQVSHLSWTKDKWLISSHMKNKYLVYIVPGSTSTTGTFKLDKDTLNNVSVESAVNEYSILSKLYNNHMSNNVTTDISIDMLNTKTTATGVYSFFEDKDVKFFVVPLSDLEDYSYTPTKEYLYNYYIITKSYN